MTERREVGSGSAGLTVSVVIPARDAGETLGECLRAIAAQTLGAQEREVIVVVDSRSRDATAEVARSHGVIVAVQSATGAAAARNVGIGIARGRWVAFTDADCIPSRGWLSALVGAAEAATESDAPALGAAGPTFGFRSDTPAARFVDLSGGLQADRHLAHERFPWAPTGNVLYRRDALIAAGGFDARFVSYEGCDLHTRLVRQVRGSFVFVPRAVVSHRHRHGWLAYWRQQVNYGRGYAQFFLRYADELPWSMGSEARAWLSLIGPGLAAAISPRTDAGLMARGRFIKALAQRRGFVTTYWRPGEATRWRTGSEAGMEAAS